MHRQILAVCLLASSLALAADEKKDDRKSSKEAKDTELKKSSSAGPAANLAGNIERKKTESGKAAPAMNYDQFRVGVENQVAGKRRDQIEQLKEIIKLNNGKDKKEMPVLLFRLGELHWEESQYYFFEA